MSTYQNRRAIPVSRPFMEHHEVSTPTNAREIGPYTNDSSLLERLSGFEPDEIVVFRGGIRPAITEIPSIKELRQLHVSRCLLVARAAMMRDGENHRVVEEAEVVNFRKGTKEHLDGLLGRFAQVHTTLGGVNSLVTVREYSTDIDSHGQLQGLAERYKREGIVPKATVAVPARDRLHLGRPDLTLMESLSATDGSPQPPTEAVNINCGIGDTIVFPNGYDTTSDIPQRLFTHEFLPACNMRVIEPTRIASISRVE